MLVARRPGAAHLLVPFAVLAVVLFVLPLARFLAVPFIPGAHAHQALLSGRGLSVTLIRAAVENTVAIGLASAGLALVVGSFFGWLVERSRWRWRALCTAAMWALLVYPSYLIATGWQTIFSDPSLRDDVLGRALFSPMGVAVLIALKAIPFTFFTTRVTYGGIASELDDAARVHGVAGWRYQLAILRLLAPPMASAFSVAFASAIQEFGIPATLAAQIRFPLVSYAIFESLSRTPLDFRGAAVLSWVLVMLAVACAAVQALIQGRYRAMLVGGRGASKHTGGPPARPVAFLAFLVLASVVVLGLVGPNAALVWSALGSDRDGVPLPILWSGIPDSVAFATLGSLIAVAVAGIFVATLSRGSRAARVVDMVALANLAIPDLVLGSAFIIAFSSAVLPIYGTPIILLLGYAGSRLPVIVRFLYAPVTQLHVQVGEAAEVHGLETWSRVMAIGMPLLLKPFFWAWLIAFSSLFFELPLSELLYPPGRPTLGVAVVTLNQGLRFAEAARLSLLAMATFAVIVLPLFAAIRYVLQDKEGAYTR